MLYFFGKIWRNRCIGAPKPSLAFGGWGLRPQTPKLFLSLNLHVTFEH